ncbi:MAG: hypothetical protein P1P88_26455, partial [Bacteroidales bacterium]|nr:hypothetical protein [Bacteroidales bacterium]
ERNEFIEKNNINLSNFVAVAIDKARCKHYLEVRPDQEEWLKGQHINLNLLLQAVIDRKMNGHD